MKNKCCMIRIVGSLVILSAIQLRTAIERSSAMFDKEKAQERLSKLSGGVAVFKVHFIFI